MQDYSSGFRISRSDLLLIWNFWHSNSFSLDHILRHGHCIVFQTVSEFIEYRFWFQVSVLVLKYSISSWQADFYRNPCNQNIRWKSVTDLWCLQLSSGVRCAGEWFWYICVIMSVWCRGSELSWKLILITCPLSAAGGVTAALHTHNRDTY